MFGGLEAILHKVHSAQHSHAVGLIPLAIAVALHSLLDGWNIGIALGLSDQRLIWAFTGSMALHKLSSGFAVGAIFRAAARTAKAAIVCAALCESLTLAGALLQQSFRRIMGDEWTIWLLALTSGSFLYLGYHALQNERRRGGLWSALRGAAVGLLTIWFVSLLHK